MMIQYLIRARIKSGMTGESVEAQQQTPFGLHNCLIIETKTTDTVTQVPAFARMIRDLKNPLYPIVIGGGL